MGLAVLKCYVVDIWLWDKSVRIIAGVILGGGLVVISFYYEKFREKFKDLAAILFVVGVFSLSSPAEAAAKATATAAPPVIADTALSWPLYAAFWVIFAVIVWRMFFIFRKDKV
ncbi:MAG TPA: hypothetical protein PLY93_13915, partial [Turneriella sp.]|nr:hypothetical protein [Turneriella sp.]